MNNKQRKHINIPASVMLLCPIVGYILVSLFLSLEPLSLLFPSGTAVTPGERAKGLPTYTDLDVTVRYGVLGTLCDDCRIVAYSSDLHTCYGICPCRVPRGEQLLISVTPCAAEKDLIYDYHFPSGRDNDFLPLTVSGDDKVVIRLEPFDRSSTVYGYVTLDDGTAAEGATVSLTSYCGGFSSLSVTTDSFGSYVFKDVPSGIDAELTVSMEGRLSFHDTITSDRIGKGSRVRRNVTLRPAEEAFTIKLINNWSDPELGARLLERFLGDSVSVIGNNGAEIPGVFSFTAPSSARYLLMRDDLRADSYRVSCSCPLFALPGRLVKSGGVIELTASEVGCVDVLSSSSGSEEAGYDKAPLVLFCLYTADGRLADSMVSRSHGVLAAAPGDYTLIAYASEEPAFPLLSEVEDKVNDYLHTSVTIRSGQINYLGSTDIPAPHDVSGLRAPAVTLPDGSTATLEALSGPDAHKQSDSHELSMSAYTSGGNILLSGLAAPRSEIILRDGSAIAGSSVADDEGFWSCRLSGSEDPGVMHSHLITAVSGLSSTEPLLVTHDHSSDSYAALTVRADKVSMGTAFSIDSSSSYSFEAVVGSAPATGVPNFSVLMSSGETITLSAHADLTRVLSRTSYTTYLSDAISFPDASVVPMGVWFTMTDGGTSHIEVCSPLKVLVNPTGHVYEAVDDNRVSGAPVSIFGAGLKLAGFSGSNTGNPIFTDPNGEYFTDAEGPLFIRAGAAEAVGSSSHADPAATLTINDVNYLPSAEVPGGINIPVTSVYPATASIVREGGKWILEFDRYVFVSTVNPDSISILLGDIVTNVFTSGLLSSAASSPLSVRVIALDAKLSPPGTPVCGDHLLAKRFALDFNIPSALTHITAVISDKVLTYNGLPAYGTASAGDPVLSKLVWTAVPLLAVMLLLFVIGYLISVSSRRAMNAGRLRRYQLVRSDMTSSRRDLSV